MYHVIQAVRRVDNAGDAAKKKNQQTAEKIRKQPIFRIEMGQLPPPAEESLAAPPPRCIFQRCSQGEGREQARNRDQKRENALDSFRSGGNARIRELVVQSQ